MPERLLRRSWTAQPFSQTVVTLLNDFVVQLPDHSHFPVAEALRFRLSAHV